MLRRALLVALAGTMAACGGPRAGGPGAGGERDDSVDVSELVEPSDGAWWPSSDVPEGLELRAIASSGGVAARAESAGDGETWILCVRAEPSEDEHCYEVRQPEVTYNWRAAFPISRGGGEIYLGLVRDVFVGGGSGEEGVTTLLVVRPESDRIHLIAELPLGRFHAFDAERLDFHTDQNYRVRHAVDAAGVGCVVVSEPSIEAQPGSAPELVDPPQSFVGERGLGAGGLWDPAYSMGGHWQLAAGGSFERVARCSPQR